MNKQLIKSERVIKIDAIEVDLTTPKLILIYGTKSNGEIVEKHLKVTEYEKLILV